jgi:SAM-dependent methyltransferase
MLNWLTRYAPVFAELDVDEGGALRESVLDVGCGPHGLSIVAPAAKFVGIEVAFHEPVAPGMLAIRYDPGALPFDDQAFDTVVCLDVLEHVPPGERAGLVEELVRVCARRVLLACPSDEAVWVEEVLKGAFAGAGVPIPEWLSEHDEHGLPTAGDIAGWCARVIDCDVRVLPMPNGLLSALMVLGDMLPGTADRAAAEWRENRREWLDLFTAATFGPCYRKGYAIQRLAPASALIDARRLTATVWEAVRCPACGRSQQELHGDVPVCGTCGHAPALDATGAWDLRAPVGHGTPVTHEAGERTVPPVADVHAEADAQRPLAGRDRERITELLLAPASWARPLDWLPALSTYIAAASVQHGATLYLDARGADVDALTLRANVERACEYVSEGAEFPPIVLLEGTVDAPPDARPVSDREELIELLHLDVGRIDDSPTEVMRHALWAKTLVDEIQAAVDKARYNATPRPDERANPLITVRIPTFGSTDDLLARAIPSALAGSYQHVEVLVCSDGPQPHARAAVASVADARVRYFELEQRPAYPSWPESFWRTAGLFAVNRLLDEARGAFIAPLDHDDAFTHEHVPQLLGALNRQGGDFVYGQAMTEWPQGDWRLHGTAPMVYGEIIHAAVMYSARLRHMRYDPDAWMLGEPVDWNLWRRMRDIGAVMCHLAEPVAVHFKERSSIDHQDAQEAGPDAMANDVLNTSARQLLRISSRRHQGTPLAAD